ncbi:hypothetical protein GWK47_034710 [Chionoecetes opilio]|uniref:Uncharacterized protein n=1 Tax=Chionoecetes opilio TaxID=41210 RepID=A0A8J4YG62_CHIOP|nr:hypothetical protein GWK47_034710 [Chionoecetes opilio]
MYAAARFIMVVPLVIVLCAGLVAAAPDKHARENSLNNYMDLVMDNLQVLMLENGLDPVMLPNTSTGFSDTRIFVMFTALVQSSPDRVRWTDVREIHRDWPLSHSSFYWLGDRVAVLN